MLFILFCGININSTRRYKIALLEEEISMLTQIDLKDSNFTQKLVSGEKVDRLCKSEELKVVEEAYDCDGTWKLLLYYRKNLVNLEVGIILMPISNCQNENFHPKEMLRVFGRGSKYKLCLEVVITHYIELTQLCNLQRVKKDSQTSF